MTGDRFLPAPRRLEERNVPPALQGLVTRVLRVGVVVSGGLLLLALVIEAVVGHGSLLDNTAPSTASAVSAQVLRGGAPTLALVGILVLVFTPLTRVAISTALFASARDRAFTLITLFVLALLGATIVVGILR
jgi:uncharacterized membrane protein